jgi:hypothetical protein
MILAEKKITASRNFIHKKVKYAHQESPQSENTEREREHVFIRISISNKTPQTINERELLGLSPWYGQWQNNLPIGV